MGFEPTALIKRDRFQDCYLKPLGHLSKTLLLNLLNGQIMGFEPILHRATICYFNQLSYTHLPKMGLEPILIELDPKSSASTNFAILAYRLFQTRRKGFEPLTSVLETKILPLNYPLSYLYNLIYNIL